MTIMAVIGITGSTDGIGRATARVLRADGTASWFTHAVASGGNPSRKHRVATSLWWLATWRGLMTYVDWPTRPASTADRHVGAQRGVWVRGSTPRTSADGHETTFAVNVLAPHLLTQLLSTELQDRLLWLGSGLAGSTRPQPAALAGNRSAARARRKQGVRRCPGPGLES